MEGQEDDFIEYGKLMSVKKHYQIINGKKEFTLDFRDSIAIDKQGTKVQLNANICLGVWGFKMTPEL